MRALRLAIVLATLVLPACHPSVQVSSSSPSTNDASSAIPAIMNGMADAWNNADLAGHVRPYADSATFMTPAGPRTGRGIIAQSLERSFWANGKPKQRLSFDQVTVRPLGDTHALQTGHFVLTGGGEADKSGWFSLTWEKTASGWRILHDHSS